MKIFVQGGPSLVSFDEPVYYGKHDQENQSYCHDRFLFLGGFQSLLRSGNLSQNHAALFAQPIVTSSD